MPENVPILLVEDQASDAALMLRGFIKAGILNPVIQLRNGDEALAYLTGMKQYGDRVRYPLPLLILMDISLPGMTGLALLQWMRQRRELRTIPVIVLSGSDDPKTIDSAYRAGASSYLIKTGDPEAIKRMTKAIGDYWLAFNQTAAGRIAALAREEESEGAADGEDISSAG
jgi:CheY-like chemotaxis protein